MGQKSQWICSALLKQIEEEQKGAKIDFFVQYETTLDSLPRMWETLNGDDLKNLTGKDLSRLRKMLYYNLEIVKNFTDSQERIQALEKHYDIRKET